MSQNSKYIFNIYVVNKSGVLMRISQVFSRRGFNIDSLAVSYAQDNKFSHITISAVGDVIRLEQIVKQVYKLVDVIHCHISEKDNSIMRELILAKILINKNFCQKTFDKIIKEYAIEVNMMREDIVILQKTTDLSTLEKILNLLEKSFEIIELRRSGPIMIEKTITKFS